jgi:hypothetical protein
MSKKTVGVPLPGEGPKPNRQERRKQLKFFTKEFAKHIDAKPKVDTSLEDEAAQQQVFRMQQWATRYGILLRKLDELGYDFDKDPEGVHQRSVEQGRKAKQHLEEYGNVQIAGMQLMPDPGQGDDEMPEG